MPSLDPSKGGLSMTTHAAPLAADSTAKEAPAENNAYELFIGVLSIMSIGVMIWMVFVRDPLVDTILITVDFIFCMIFLIDFVRSFRQAPSKRAYMFGAREPGARIALPRG